MASPAECVRSILLKAELAVFPTDDLQLLPDTPLVPCYCNQFPDQPDKIIALYNMQGTTFGRDMSGRYNSHPGVKVQVRALTDNDAYDLIASLSTFFANRLSRQSVPIRGYENFVASVSQMGDPISLGEETGTKRSIYVMNLQVAMEDLATAPLE